MRLLRLLAVTTLLASCTPGPGPTAVASPTAPGGAPPSRTAVPQAYRELTALGDFMRLSPDGETVVSMVQGPKGGTTSYVFQRLDGRIVGKVDNLTGMSGPEWLRDSSAVLISLAAGQRAGPLGVLTPDGRLLDTGLDDANPALSPDGTWIAAERQEGCCAGIRIHEIRIAPRAGGPARTLVTSTDPALQPISLLGWSPGGEVVYRDGAHVRGVTLDGRITELAAPGRMLTRSATAPDGRAILACAADPLAFWVISAGRVTELRFRPAWPLREPWCSRPGEVIWLGGHELPVRDEGGSMLALDPVTGTTRPLSLPAGSRLVGASGDVLLVAIGGELHGVSTSTGLDRAIGLPIAADSVVRPLDRGRFHMITGLSSYLIG